VKVIPEGQCIQHTQYGVGFVTEADAERTTIDFIEHGPKKFVTSLMTVSLVADAPPRPKRPRRAKKA
jgi:hypothetical protein